VEHAVYGEIERGGGLSETTFRWQSSKEAEALQDGSFKDWLSSRPLALRPMYWEISSDAYTSFKMGYEAEMEKIYIWSAPTRTRKGGPGSIRQRCQLGQASPESN